MEFRITNQKELDKAFKRASNEDLSIGWTLVFKQHEERRRDAQNRLLYAFLSQISKQSGHGIDYERGYYKLNYGCPILERDDADFAEFMGILRYNYTYDKLIEIMSTERVRVSSDMTVKQFAEYLTDIKNNAESRGIILTSNEDEYLNSLLNG